MLAFDMPVPFNPIGRRNISNVPSQALILMNDPFVIQQSQHWARQVLQDSETTPTERIARLYATAFTREAAPEEVDAALDFLRRQSAAHGMGDEGWRSDERPWADLCHVLWNVKEFIFVH